MKVNYLNKKDLLIEIHKSKLTYCSLINDEFQNDIYKFYDMIIVSLDEITQDLIEYTKKYKSERLYKQKRDELIKMGFKPHEIKLKSGPDTIKDEDVVFRIITYDHIPVNKKPKKTKNISEKDKHEKTNFTPFKHYIFINGKPEEVLRSHWKGNFETGYFSIDHGHMTNNLAKMFMKIVEKFSQKGNWRGYTYIDEMRSQALLQLSQIGLQFDEDRSNIPNPFAYYTAAINNSFTRVLNIEKKNQCIRDDILESYGATPSYTRQSEWGEKTGLTVEEIANMDSEGNIVKVEKPPVVEIAKPKGPMRKPKSAAVGVDYLEFHQHHVNNR